MAFCTVNGHAASGAQLSLPRVGVWVANITLDTEAEVTGAVELDLGGRLFAGVARRNGLQDGWRQLRIVGGAGGLNREVPAKGYKQVPLRIPLEDVLRAAGETLATSSSNDVLNLSLAYWGTMRGPAGRAVGHLVECEPEASWRILADGALWVGKESWTEVAVEHEVITTDPLLNKMSVLAEDPVLGPGQTFLGRHVSYVQHLLEGDRFRTLVHFE